MAKIIIVLAVMSFVFVAKGQEAASPSGAAGVLTPEEAALQFSDVVMTTVGIRVENIVLPEDLKLVAAQVVVDTRAGLNECENQLKTTNLIWQYKVCASTQLGVSMQRLSALEVEAAGRNSTSSAAGVIV